jgi:hypothetical protein
MPFDSAEPARRLQAKCHRNRLLHQGAARDRRALELPCKPGQGIGQVPQSGLDEFERTAQLKHQAGIHRVLAGRTPVHEARGIAVPAFDQRGQRLDHRDRGIAGRGRAARQRPSVEQIGTALRFDLHRRRTRDDARARRRPGERRLEVQHALEPRAVRKHLFENGPPE